MASQHQKNPPTIPLKIFADKLNNKVIAVEATKDFVDTLFSFLSLPLATIIRLLPQNSNNNENPPLLGCINNLYQSAQNLTPNDVWNNVCKQMLLFPRNPCEELCLKLFLNLDDAQPTPNVRVCNYCYKFTTFPDLDCSCGKPANMVPENLDLKGQGNGGNVEASRSGVFVKENGSMFLVFDDLTVVPSTLLTSMQMLLQLGYSDLTHVEEVTQNIGKEEVIVL